MTSVLREITQFRAGRSMVIDYKNSNRYRVVFQESDGTRTAYYFSTPIYNVHTRKAVDLNFREEGHTTHMIGSNADITISNEIRLQNAEGYCLLTLDQSPRYVSAQEVRCGNDVLLPTTNGIAYKAYIKDNTGISLDMEVQTPFMPIRANDKYFSLMREEFRPFVTVSCIGTVDAGGEVIAPAAITYQKLDDRKYRLTVTPCSPLGTYVLFELNLYEPKLFQDTTVESLNPKTNNAFGGTAFIGNTAAFGEQWLYSRPDFSKMSDVMDKRIERAILHLPQYNHGNVELSAFRVAARFCSFGSNWDNKIAASSALADTTISHGYQSLDVTDLVTDPRTKYMTSSEGLILKTRVKGSGFSAIATGDSYYAPQIFEINFK